MKTNYGQQLDALAASAQLEILNLCMEHGMITIFDATGKEAFEEEWTVDIYDDVPDFPFYDKHAGVEWAAVKELKWDGTNLYITGILKRDSYPDLATVSLQELDAYSSCALADYLSGMELPKSTR